MNPWQKILALLSLSIFVYLFFIYSIKTPNVLDQPAIQMPSINLEQPATIKSEFKPPILPLGNLKSAAQRAVDQKQNENLPVIRVADEKIILPSPTPKQQSLPKEDENLPIKKAEPTKRHVLAVAESSNEGAGYEKERLSEANSSWWNTKKGAGFPQWIIFDIGSEGMNAINFRNVNGCSTAPKDIVFYNSDSVDGPWNEIGKYSRPKSPGGVWWQAPVESHKKYLKAEFLNNQSSAGPPPSNKDWPTYTYIYEVTVEI